MSEDGLIGTWRLVSFEVRDENGRITHPFGRDAVGFISYAADGHMAVQVGRTDRVRRAIGDWTDASSEEVASAARDYIAYCGTYEFANGEVRHQVELSLMPNLIGGELVRSAAFEGDRVTLSTPPTPIDGRQQIATLVWERT